VLDGFCLPYSRYIVLVSEISISEKGNLPTMVQFCIHEGAAQGHCSPQIDLNQLQELFQVTAFWAQDRRIEDWAIALENSKPIATVWDFASPNSEQEDRLIGFARATSDGIYRATIWDVVIHPDYQGIGLGRKLVETVLMHPHINRAERVYLMTSRQQNFYERIGFECNSTITMVLHNQPVSQHCMPVSVEAGSSS
jgi:GNAT superfamily N-acetyltransferase